MRRLLTALRLVNGKVECKGALVPVFHLWCATSCDKSLSGGPSFCRAFAAIQAIAKRASARLYTRCVKPIVRRALRTPSFAPFFEATCRMRNRGLFGTGSDGAD